MNAWRSFAAGPVVGFANIHVSVTWTLRILSSMSEGVCEWLIQRDREFLNVWASCGQ